MKIQPLDSLVHDEYQFNQAQCNVLWSFIQGQECTLQAQVSIDDPLTIGVGTVEIIFETARLNNHYVKLEVIIVMRDFFPTHLIKNTYLIRNEK